jgi:hypothetical protein
MIYQSEASATCTSKLDANAAYPLQAQGHTFFDRYGGFHTVAAVAIPHPKAQRYASIPALPKTEQDLFEIVPPVFTMTVARLGRPGGLGFVFIRSIEHNRRGVLVQPRRWNGIGLQRFARDGAEDAVEIGSK